ncbi:class I SAM-dependent methyltransferase [Bradyrhizobium sp. DOA9]|uniref:class I SAM-dependent methyltransferase n=1 Tax=Bradyrhizobium sp. DOA9 TaxID=1126627 RepID=UPI000694FD2E|nr:methyltransferase domain-containing protein [Bradyrhizobium sp. DOA9]
MIDLTPEQSQHWRQHYSEHAKYWEKWADPMAEQQEKINQMLLDAAGVSEGMSVLDLASGAGEPAMTAARRVGSHGSVTVTDVAPEMVEAARRRSEKLGLGNISFETAAMERLPFSDDSFDAITCRYGLMYCDDPAAAWRECARVLKGGRRAAHMVWGPEENNTMVWTVMRAANNSWDNPISDEEVGHPLRFAANHSLLPFVMAAGLVHGKEQDIEVQPRIKVGVPFWQPLIEINAGAIWSGLAQDARQRTKEAVIAALEPFRDGEFYRFKTHMRIAVGTKAD